MKPLQTIAMGLVIAVLTASVNGHDILADPIGWVLILLGLATVPVPQRAALLWLATISLVVSVFTWFPSVRDDLNMTDLALAWTAALPELITVLVLAHALAQRARLSGDATACTWLRTSRTLFVVVILAPPVVLGGGLTALDGALAILGSLSLVLLIVLLFRYAARPWAAPTPTGTDVPSRT